METSLRNKALLQLCLQAAADAGVPGDQAQTMLQSNYVPYPWQWRFHAAAREADKPGGPVDIGCGGARGPGKSHAVLSQVGLDDCQRMPELKCLFLRQTGISAKESFDDLVRKVLKYRVAMDQTLNLLRFPNGSKILLGGFKNESDIDKYTGIEYDVIIVEELNQLTQEKYTKLRGSLRTSKPTWRPRMYTSFNPGGIGHDFVRARYVIPQREHTESETRFIPSNYKENPALNREYLEYLESLGGNLGRAWREGDWDLFEGMYFTEWNHDRHVEEPFKIPLTWPIYRSIDPSGREGVTSCHWYAVDQNGRAHVYREYYKTGLDLDEHAKNIDKLSRDAEGVEEGYKYTVIDAAAFAKAGYSETAAEIFERNGVVNLIPAAKERVIGWNAVHTYLRWTDKDETGNPQGPKLKVFSNCVNMIRTIPLAQHDELHPEDVASHGFAFKDADGREGTEHQDAIDELRYFLRTLRETKAPTAPNLIERKLAALKQQSSGEGFDYQYRRRTL